MVNEDQCIQMQHGISVTNFQQLRMNRLMPVLHERVHQAQAIVVATRLQCVGIMCLSCGKWRADSTVPAARAKMLSHHYQVTFHVIKPRNSRQQSPALESEPLK